MLLLRGCGVCSPQSLISLLGQCKGLTELDMSGTQGVDDATLSAVGCLPLLQRLQLLHRNPTKRLGAGEEGATNVKAHKFFVGALAKRAVATESVDSRIRVPDAEVGATVVTRVGVDWDRVLRRAELPEFTPELGEEGLNDTSHFDDMLVRLDPY